MPAPRIIIISPDQWPRALLRSALREVGYDAVGTQSLTSALRIPVREPGRSPVRAIVVEQSALGGGDGERLGELLARHERPATLLLSHTTTTPPAGSWSRELRRPFSIDDAVRAVQTLLPLPDAQRRPVD